MHITDMVCVIPPLSGFTVCVDNMRALAFLELVSVVIAFECVISEGKQTPDIRANIVRAPNTIRDLRILELPIYGTRARVQTLHPGFATLNYILSLWFALLALQLACILGFTTTILGPKPRVQLLHPRFYDHYSGCKT